MPKRALRAQKCRLKPAHRCVEHTLQAKDLVESAPCTIATGIKREEAVKMVEKLKAEVPAEYELV